MKDKGQCFMSGYCCTQGVCSYGVWDSYKHQCKHLDKENDMGQRKCLIKKDIEEAEEMSGELYSIFGFGCSSTIFNSAREKVKEQLNNKEIAMKCSICGKDIKSYRCNAQPVNSGTCCQSCDDNIVTPRRMRDAGLDPGDDFSMKTVHEVVADEVITCRDPGDENG